MSGRKNFMYFLIPHEERRGARMVSCSVNFGARCTRWWPLAHERVYKLALKNGLRVVRRGSTWFFLLPFFTSTFCQPLAIRVAPAVCSCYVAVVEKREREQGLENREGDRGKSVGHREESRES